MTERNRLSKGISLFLVVVTLLTVVALSATISVSADDNTEVRFRVVLPNDRVWRLVSCTLSVTRYTDNTYTTPMVDDEGFNYVYFIRKVYRDNYWQRTVDTLPHGFYKVTNVSFDNSWDRICYGETDGFEIKGDKMTVYVGAHETGKTVEMPEQWLVYGEDTQEFGIWASKEESSEEPSESSDEDYSLPPLESEDTEVVPDDRESSVPNEQISSVVVPDSSDGAENRGGLHPGTIVILVVLVFAIIACAIVIYRTRHPN